MKVVLITGASSGLGAEFARQLDRLGAESGRKNPIINGEPRITEDTCFWLVARRMERLKTLSKELHHKCRLFPLDLKEEESIQTLRTALEEEKAEVVICINGAGLGYYGKADKLLTEQINAMLDVNIKAHTLLTKAVSPFLAQQAWLVQIASSAAFLPQPGFSVYAASKAYVYSLSRALRRELRERKIHVTALCPGPVSTEFFQIAETTNYNMPAYKKLFFSKQEPVVKKCLRDVRNNRSISVYGIFMKLLHVFSRLLPWKLLLKFF